MAMSPDGRTLAICRANVAEACDLFLVAASGGEPRNLTNDSKSILAWLGRRMGAKSYSHRIAEDRLSCGVCGRQIRESGLGGRRGQRG